MALRKRFLNVAIALDQLAWTVVTLGAGSPDETISAALWRMESQGKRAGVWLRPVVDWLAWTLFRDGDHCMKAFFSERNKQQLPEAYRE